MKRMMTLGLLLVLVLSLAVVRMEAGAVALEAPGGTPGPPGGGPANTPGARATAHASLRGKPTIYRGTITAVDPGSLTLTLDDGNPVTIGLTADTKIRVPGPNAQGNDLLAGMRVLAWAYSDENGNTAARAVMVVPGKPVIAHRVGTVIEYAAGASITIMAVDGNAYTFALTADTKILPDGRAGELAVGSRVTVIAPRDPAALDWTAAGIVVHPASQ